MRLDVLEEFADAASLAGAYAGIFATNAVQYIFRSGRNAKASREALLAKKRAREKAYYWRRKYDASRYAAALERQAAWKRKARAERGRRAVS